MSRQLFAALTSPPVEAIADRATAHERLERFLGAGLRHYATSRNADLGPADRSNVSGLSPYIRHRLILEEEVLRAVLTRLPLSRSEKFVQEVLWRSYFKGWLEHHPSVWHAYCRDLRDLEAQLAVNDRLRDRYEKAIDGRTGIDCFDAWTEELRSHGYLHNHARMWFASIWIFTLDMPWQLGADFFLRHLLDGDAAANTLGWRWVGGLHTRGKTYLARPDNIRKYTVGRFDPDPRSLASTAASLTEPQRPSRSVIDPGEVPPTGGRFGLIVTDDDCCPDTIGLAALPVATLGLSSTEARSPFEVSAAVRQFSCDAVSDALRRFESATGCRGEMHDGPDWGETVSRWARKNDLEAIVTSATPQGPGHDLLAQAERLLRVDGVRLLRIRRPYDRTVWPHATRGFFKLRKAIAQLVDTLGLDRPF